MVRIALSAGEIIRVHNTHHEPHEAIFIEISFACKQK